MTKESDPGDHLAAPTGIWHGIERLADAGGRISTLCLVAIAVLVCVEVVVRSFFHTSTMIADEVSGYLNAALVTLGLGYALKEGSFVRMEFTYRRLRGRVRDFVNAAIALVALVFAVLMSVLMARHVLYSYDRGTVSIDFLQTPLYIPQAVVFVGFVILALMLCRYLRRGGRDLP